MTDPDPLIIILDAMEKIWEAAGLVALGVKVTGNVTSRLSVKMRGPGAVKTKVTGTDS